MTHAPRRASHAALGSKRDGHAALGASPLTALGALAGQGERFEAAPVSVALFCGFQNELGCVADYAPDCPAMQFAVSSFDTVWRETFSVMAGDWTYKVVLDGDPTQNYGAGQL